MQHPAFLPPGTVVGSWRVVAWVGRGVYGAVYLAVPVEDEKAPPVALKIALHPRDARFAREAELHARTNHPHIPRLVDHGVWQSPMGTLHPFLCMQWVDGLRLYVWAQLHPLTSQQVCGLLAQLARALQALHAQGCVHRDVKGDNVLVRLWDGHAFLTDFGSGIHPGAATLTPHDVFPGTPAYRSPESWLFELQFLRDRAARYHAGPADDLYALGVTACRLLTGKYPELADPHQDEHGTWYLEPVIVPPALLSDAHVEPRLRAVVLRMLSVRPEERGTAAELAGALEELALEQSAATPEAVEPPLPIDDTAEAHASEPREISASLQVQERIAEQGSAASGATEGFRLPAPARPAWPWLTLAAVAMVLLVWAPSAGPGRPPDQLAIAQAKVSGEDSPDAGTAGLGEVAATRAPDRVPSTSSQQGMIQDKPPKPLPEQARPDEKGRCPHKELIVLNGGCWGAAAWGVETCSVLGGQMFKGTCYVPFIPPGRRPTSSPPDKP